LFGGFLVSGADSRTAINDAVAGRPQVPGLIAAAALTFVLVALTDVMKYLPVAALGAVIASAAIDVFDTRELRWLWQTSHADFLFALIAMLGVIGLGVLKGVLIATVAASVYLLARVSRPSDALLGCIPGRDGFYKLHREPRATQSGARLRNSSALRRIEAAPRLSLKWASEEVPGIGNMTGERGSNHAGAICPGVAPWRSAIVASGESGRARRPLSSGQYRMKAMPAVTRSCWPRVSEFARQRSSTASAFDGPADKVTE
jgi:hypothetical protein